MIGITNASMNRINKNEIGKNARSLGFFATERTWPDERRDEKLSNRTFCFLENFFAGTYFHEFIAKLYFDSGKADGRNQIGARQKHRNANFSQARTEPIRDSPSQLRCNLSSHLSVS